MASSPSGGRGKWLLFPIVVAALVGAAPASACYARLFSFGDSLADTGNYRFLYANASDPAQRLPYGETFFHRATGRFTDGRIVLDFIADALGLPFVRPYLGGRRAEDFARGANFAVGGATALIPEFFRIRGFDMDDETVHLDMEMKWFRDMLGLLCPDDLAVTIIYADYYGAAMEVFVSPKQYGIEHPLVACCGGGHPYGVTPGVRCGRGEYSLCHNPEKYGSWVGMHPSEAVYRAIAMGLLRGSYTQPPIATTANSCTHLAELGFSIEYKPL